MTLEALEIRHIRSVLESTNWRVRGRGGAAERLGLKPTTLESRMARLGITRKKVSVTQSWFLLSELVAEREADAEVVLLSFGRRIAVKVSKPFRLQ